jgi:hypothetical protein
MEFPPEPSSYLLYYNLLKFKGFLFFCQKCGKVAFKLLIN